VFKDSLAFPFVLSMIGVAVIAAGLFYHRRQDAFARWLDANLPRAVLLPRLAHAHNEQPAGGREYLELTPALRGTLPPATSSAD
jgi:hypothetical protein